MKDDILAEIASTSIAKEKNKKCADAIQSFISELSPPQLEKFWNVANLVADHHSYTIDQLLNRNCE